MDIIKKVGGWSNFILLCILVFFLAFGLFRRLKRTNNASYVYGISEGVKKGSKGSLYLHYYFKVEGIIFTGSVPEEFCRKCRDCCKVGNRVTVRFESDNPENSDLVTSVPSYP